MIAVVLAVAAFAQSALTETEAQFVIWLAVTMGGIIIAILGFGGKRVIKRLDAHAEERKEVMTQVAQVAEDHRAEVKEIYERIFAWNETTTASLAEQTTRFDRVDVRLESIEGRLARRRERAP